MNEPDLPRRARWRTLLACAALLAGPAGAAADPDPPPPLALPVAEGLVLDGRGEEAAWAAALEVPLGPLHAPGRAPGPPVPVPARLRALVSDGALWLLAEVAEDPGSALGLQVFLAPPGAQDAAEAVAYAWRPLDPRAARWTARGPRGVGRGVYRALGAVDVARPGAWSGEVAIGLADLDLPAGEPLRAALTLLSRTPQRLAPAPPGALATPPARWLVLRPPDAGWPRSGGPSAARCSAEDAADLRARQAWLEFLKAKRAPVAPGLAAPAARAHLEAGLLAPLAAVEAARPDLGVPLAVLRGDLLWRCGLAEDAAAHFEAALVRAPGWREALFGRYLQVEAQRLATDAPGAASDYAARLGALDAAPPPAAPERAPWHAEARDLARGLLELKHGDFAAAAARLGPLAERHPQAPWIVMSHQHAVWGTEAWPDEQVRWRRDAEASLPRATLVTDRGEIVIELFQHEVPNSVNHFVWLAEHGWYDGQAVDTTVPFLLVGLGDPATRAGARAGVHDPGYAIRPESSAAPADGGAGPEGPRLPFRGSVLLAREPSGQVGSRFHLLVGSALHLAGQLPVLGRIVDGMEVAERLRAGDRLRTVRVSGKTAGWTYRPQALAGEPAPPPR